MKTTFPLTLIFCLFHCVTIFGQISPNAAVATASVATFNGTSGAPPHSNILEAYILDTGTNTLNTAMLNVFFKNEINSFASGAKDISLETNFLSINTDDKTLTLGRNLSLKRMRNLADKELRSPHDFLTLSATTGITKGFSNVYYQKTDNNAYNFASEISASIKFVHIGNGWIWFSAADQAAITAFRNNSIDGELRHQVAQDYITAGNLIPKYYGYYKKIADKEIENIKANRLYTLYFDWWFGADINVPLTAKEINHKNTATAGAFEKTNFRSWKASVFIDGLFNFPSLVYGSTFNLRGSASYFNTNTFITSNAKPTTFQTINDANGNVQVLEPADLVFIGPYDEFNNGVGQIELSSLYFNNTVGLSGAIDYNVGDYKAKNWKLGIPVSLKDKDKKPLVNFEVQWKEVNGIHAVGISAGYAFGKFTK